MKKMKNETHIEGYVYEHKLEKKVSGETSKNPGTEYIAGTLSIATDDALTNVVQVHFTYVTATTKKGGSNNTFAVLNSIIEGKIGSVMANGKDNAGMVRIDSAIDLNEWYDKNGDFVSTKRNEGGFVHQTSELNAEAQRATFETDIVINNCVRMDANEERNLPERMIVKGAIFNFRNALLPVDFTVRHPGAMDYFESLEASPNHPVFTRVKGQQVSQTSVRTVTEESAFGDASVREVKSSFRDYVITWAQQEPYEWDSEETILASEMSEAVANREIRKAEIKKNQDEYQNSRGNAIPAAAPAKGAYNF